MPQGEVLTVLLEGNFIPGNDYVDSTKMLQRSGPI